MEPQRSQQVLGAPVNGAPAMSSQQHTSLTALLSGPAGQGSPFPQLASMFPTHGVPPVPGPAPTAYRPLASNAAQFFTGPNNMLTPSPARKGGASGPPRSGAGGKKQCNCKNSRCLKLYCECFASGRYCESCNCVTCLNNRENEATRQSAVEAILERNPNAFRPKIQGSEAEIAAARSAAAADGLAPRHTKGCNCKKSTCLKKYCECFQASIYCSDMCKCVDCKNYEGSEARAQVMAVTEMGGGVLPGAFGASASMPLASPSKRPRSQSQASLPVGGGGQGALRPLGSGGMGALLTGSQGQQLQQLLAGAGPGPGSLRMGALPNTKQSTFQQVLSELVPTPMIEDLCRLLLIAADSEQQRMALQQQQDGGAGGDVDMAQAGGGDGSGAGGGAGAPDQVYEAQERAVLEEFGVILGKIVESAIARCSPGAGGGGGADAQAQGQAQGQLQGQQGLQGLGSGPGGLPPRSSPLPGQDFGLLTGGGASSAASAAAAVAALGLVTGGAGSRQSFVPAPLPLTTTSNPASFMASLPGFGLGGAQGLAGAFPGPLVQGQGQAASNAYLAAAAAAAAAMVQAFQAGATAAPAPPSLVSQTQVQQVMQLSQQPNTLQQQQQQQALNQLQAAFALRQQQQQQQRQQGAPQLSGQGQGSTSTASASQQ